MIKVNIVYTESPINSAILRTAQRDNGDGEYRPPKFKTIAEYPIIPRPGDHIFFNVLACHARYMQQGDTHVGAVVEFVELEDGVEDIYVHVTDW